MSDHKIRVFIVDDSSVFVKFLKENLVTADPRIEIVGTAMSASEAMRKIPTVNPDVVTMDIEMPRTNGIEFLKELLPCHPVPVILVSSLSVNVFDALATGAVDFVKKPDMSHNYSSRIFITNLATKILIASTASVKIPKGFGEPASVHSLPKIMQDIQKERVPQTQGIPVSRSLQGISSVGVGVGDQNDIISPEASVNSRSDSLCNLTGNLLTDLKITTSNPRLNNMIIALGASTGGTEATLQILQQLPSNTPGIVITQHMPEGFTSMYAKRLNRLCKMDVKEAVDGDVVSRGKILVAPGGDKHMKIVRLGGHYTVRLFQAEKVNGHCPSVDVLFSSAAQTAGKNAIGIILTGMGQDGAYGLLEMRNNGAYTIGQNKESCVVYGMPMVAQNIGAVCQQASCDNIATVLINHLNKL